MPHCRSEFLSHGEYAAVCAEAARKREVLVTRVQVKTPNHPIPRCGVIKDAFTVGTRDFFKIEFDCGRISSVATVHVRKCSGLDGKCQCATKESKS